MSGHPAVHLAAVTEEVEAEVRELVRRIGIVFEPSADWDQEVGPVTSWYVNRLAGRLGDEEAQRAAMEVATALAGEKAKSSAWWDTALGRATGWWIGYTEEAVPQNTAANVLGVRRQAVTQFITSGTLKTIQPEGLARHVERDSLLKLLRRRYRDYQ